MSFSQILQRVRAMRQGGAYPAKAFIWLHPGEDQAAKIEAERAAGRIGPSTEVCAIRWLEVDSANALPALPASASSTEASRTAERLAAVMKKLNDAGVTTGA